MSDSQTLPVLPLDDLVALPGMVVPVSLTETDARAAIEAAQTVDRKNPRVLLVPRVDGRHSGYGALGVVEQIGRFPGGERGAVVRAVSRMRIGVGTTGPGAALWVEATVAEATDTTDEQVEELARDYRALLTTLLQQRGAWQMIDSLRQVDEATTLADLAGYAPYLTQEQKAWLLETPSVKERLEKLIGWTREHLAELEIAESINNDVKEGMERQQREFLLRQQLSAIRKELAELSGEPASEEQDYRARVEAANLPEQVHKAAMAEVDKLERTSEQSPEVGWIRTWLDTVLDLPWNTRTEDSYDIPAARAVLEADHAGLEDVKDRIVEYLAVRKRREQRQAQVTEQQEQTAEPAQEPTPAPGRESPAGGNRRGGGAVLALVGPPGVGKTSLGESVARAMGRTFTRVALGGVRDEAEIRGHRRTYVGALPGRIVRAIADAGTMNPVILLDEVDKLGADYRGDPTAALLEVLDPAQNHTFRDHYLDVELDLSDVVFLATANVLEMIPEPLLDRMELVQLDGYTEDEKVTIARDHLLPRQLDRAGLSADEVRVDDSALRRLAREYTREAGVRQLERAVGRVLRKVVAALSGAETDRPALPVQVDADSLRRYLGPPKHTPESAERTSVPGVATGLAVTGVGGEVLFVEASLADRETGPTDIVLTGQLGDVMKESARIALSYLRSHGAELELPVGDLANRGVHVHVPAGAVPKDGPSAGVTMTTALASLLSGRPTRANLGMTGEVSLTGRVLPIGGVKQKLLAAHRAGLTTVLLPKRNEPDLDEVPEAVREALTIHLVADVREVLDLALEPARTAAPPLAAVA